MRKLVVFDLDGTLVDSVPDLTDCVNITLKKFGHGIRSEKEIAQMIGNGARNLIIRAVGDALSEQEIDQRLNYYNDIYTNCGNPKTKLFDGIYQVLIELKKRGFMLGILTNKPQSATEKVYQSYLSDIGFDAIIGQNSSVKIKPDPTALLECIEKLGVNKQNVYMVGDGEPDAQVAINAKVNGISVLYGYRTKEQLTAVGATVFAEKVSDLIDLIK